MKVRGTDERFEGRFIDVLTWTELHVAHLATAALEQLLSVGEFGPVIEANVHVGSERVHVAERGVLNAGGGAAVVHEFANVSIAALAEGFEPAPGNQSKLWHPGIEPLINRRFVRLRA